MTEQAQRDRKVIVHMVFQPVPDTVAVVVEQGSDTINWSNTLHFSRPSFVEADMDTLGIDVFDAWASGGVSYLANNFSFRKVTVYDLRVDGAPVRVPTVTPQAGQKADEYIDVNACLVITTRTNQRGRSGRGRSYISGFTEIAIAEGAFTASDGNDALLALNAAVAAGVADGWTRVVVSRYHDGAKRAAGVTYAATADVIRSLIPGKQSRRNKRP